MVTSELGSVLVYVEKTPVSSFSSKGDMLSRRAVSHAGFLPFSKEERRHTRRKNTFPNTLVFASLRPIASLLPALLLPATCYYRIL